MALLLFWGRDGSIQHLAREGNSNSQINGRFFCFKHSQHIVIYSIPVLEDLENRFRGEAGPGQLAKDTRRLFLIRWLMQSFALQEIPRKLFLVHITKRRRNPLYRSPHRELPLFSDR